MKTILTLLMTLVIVPLIYGQDALSERFRQLYGEQKYDEIIKYRPKKKEDLSAKALYYKGMSHFMKSEDNDAMKYLDLAIAKGPVDYDMYFYKGMVLFYENKLTESLPYYDKAIAMLPGEPDYYAGKAEAYYKLDQKDSALVYFEKAASLSRAKPHIYIMIGNICQEQKNNAKALVAYKVALEHLNTRDENYQNCSFNLGLSQLLTGKAQDAKETFENHIYLYPTDYHAMAKLIQAYYALSEFDKAAPYKEKLYAAHKANKLQDEMKEMFCFDQFMWKGKRVIVFENFDEGDQFMFVKHRFYVMADNGDIEYQIDSESSIAIRMNGPKNKYVLCLVKGQSHSTYWQYVFNDDYKYPELKTAVLNILNDQVKPGETFIPGKTERK